ncbi:MAG: hypothetical protein BMS9Abin13_495 [Patescibacteria group bacterium]|nr:MAG: hypothetical protein BMS9Abin13_495 [Patescibacteria group bacterium]
MLCAMSIPAFAAEWSMSYGIDAVHGESSKVIFLERHSKNYTLYGSVLSGKIFDDRKAYALGGEYILKSKSKRFIFGGGLVYLSETNEVNGTKLNFSFSARYVLNENWSLFYRHWSHGRQLGIKEDKENDGWNFLGIERRF